MIVHTIYDPIYEGCKKEYDPGITKEKWIELLQSGIDKKYLQLLKRWLYFNGKGFCTEIDIYFCGRTSKFDGGTFGSEIYKKTNCNLDLREKSKYKSYSIIFLGRDANDKEKEHGSYIWILRPELWNALEELGGINGKLLYDIPLYSDLYSWIPFYKEIVNKLLEFNEKREQLAQITYTVLEEFSTYIKNSDGNNIEVIDPFTFMGIFNRQISTSTRIQICELLKKEFGLKEEIPKDFDGVPLVNTFTSTFFTKENLYLVIDNLWNLFIEAINYSKKRKNQFIHCFNTVKAQTGIKWNITLALFWLDPTGFINLDLQNRKYLLNEYNLRINNDDNYSGQDYVNFNTELYKKMRTNLVNEFSFPELSYNAWKYDTLHSHIKGVPQMTDNKQKLDEYITLLEANHNLIFHGAPGTGKTFTAKEMAAQMIFRGNVPENFENDPKFKEQFEFVQFHPSYDYTDFVEGLRPSKSSDGNVNGFERVDGVFKKFCAKAIVNSLQKENTNKKDDEPTEDEANISADSTVWKVSLFGTGDNPIRKDCLENGYIRIGWHGYGDVENFEEYQDFSVGGKNILIQFQNEMQVGDVIISCFSEKETDAIGIVTSDYYYDEKGDEYPRYRKVKWLVKNIQENIISINQGKRMTLSTVYKMKISVSDLIEIINKYSDVEKIQKNKFDFEKNWDKLQNVLTKDNFIELETKSRTKFRVQNKNENALEVVLFKNNNFGEAENWSLTKDNFLKILNSEKHASPNLDCYRNPVLAYMFNIPVEVESAKSKRPFIFLIDEINRGETSKIFGELFFSIDPGYRGIEGRITTQYQNLVEGGEFAKGFYVPENVYIIGTMNDIDRSVETMDFAFRRRFAWKEIKAKDTQNMLDSLINVNGITEETINHAKEKMNAINQKIAKTPDLDENYQIGAAYFMKLSQYGGDFEALWNYHIKGLITEYLRGQGDLAKLVAEFKTVYDGTNFNENNE